MVKIVSIMFVFLIMSVVVIHGRYSQDQANAISTRRGVDIEREKKSFASFRFRPKGMV